MKKNLVSLFAFAIIFGGLCSACSKKDEKPAAKAALVSRDTTGVPLPNYRYVDIDTILSKYHLSQDYNEEMMRLQANLESEAKRHENSIKSFASQMQNKYQNNQYTEQTYNADQSKLQQMQNSAASSIDKMQSSSAQAAMKAQQVITDSIESFIKVYNSTRHYDAILYKAATLYINPDLDITEEVVEGLNARYNKAKK